MTEQEAIERIIEHRDIHRLKEQRAFYITDAFDMAIKALEKQIPKEPYRISGIDSNDNAMVDCPICKAGNETSIKTIKQIYCWNCGQAIKWE